LRRSPALQDFRGTPSWRFGSQGPLRSVSSELGLTIAVTRAAALEAAEARSREAVDEEAVARATAAGEAMTVESLLGYFSSPE
jgi:hypothetical protein